MVDQKILAETLLEHSDYNIYSVRPGKSWSSWHVETVSQKVGKLGYLPDEFLHQPELWASIVHPDDLESLEHSIKEIVSSRKLGILTYRVRHKQTAEYHWVENKCVPMFDAEGGLLRILGMARDITAEVENERALADSEAQLRALFESAPDAVIISNSSGIITKANAKAEDLFGHPRAELCGRPFAMLIPQHFRVEQFLSAIAPAAAELATLHPGGGETPVDVMSSFAVVNGERLVLTILRDISTRKQLERERNDFEEQFRQAQKMDALGKLAEGVAHDFNNLLMLINGHSDLLLKKMSSENPLHASLSAIRKAGANAAGLTQQLLSFGRKQVSQPRAVSLNEILTGAHAMLRRMIPANVDFVTSLAPDLGQVRIDPVQIEQVLMNLAVNARDAMPGGGRLLMATENVELDELAAMEHKLPGPGKFVQLSVSDSGTGMTPEVKASLFEPFFTTKKIGEGTGLGLSIVYGIVKQAGGFIEVFSDLGVGTTFKIYLPQVSETPAHDTAAPAPETPPRGTETVLVVEDQAEVRKLIHGILTAGGYRVLEASDPVEAVVRAEDYKGPIHLLLTDIMMPGLDGHELAAILQPQRPEMKLLLMSGYSQTTEAVGNTPFLQKPFSSIALAEKVQQVLKAPIHGRILVVDDDEGVRTYVTKVLRSAGYETVTAAHGKQAVEELERSSVDLVVMDLIMPVQEGIETILQVRDRWPDLKVIAMSGGPYLEVALRLGAHAKLAKPVPPDLLVQTVKAVLTRT
ncbi:MAG: response regulator [Candidatus Solibacter usitatus]|nr:response regulator [Candidatus Solibacter usitatus]